MEEAEPLGQHSQAEPGNENGRCVVGTRRSVSRCSPLGNSINNSTAESYGTLLLPSHWLTAPLYDLLYG